MSFTGNGGGRFQIRRIRNGFTTEALIIGDGPFQQDFSDPTGFHEPNWDTSGTQSTAANQWAAGTTYQEGDEVIFGDLDNQSVYRSLINNNTGNSPTLIMSNDFWEWEGYEGDPLILSPQLFVNGVNSPLNGTRAAAPINSLITGVTWQVLANGAYENVNTATTTPARQGFRLITDTQAETEYSGDNRGANVDYPDTGTNTWLLAIDRNLNDVANFNAGALREGRLYLRARITYQITGVQDSVDRTNPQDLTADAYIVIQRTVLTESSMFSRIQLVDTGESGSSAQIWNSGFTGSKTMEVDLFIGANNIIDDTTSDIEILWFRVEAGDDTDLVNNPQTGITFPSDDTYVGDHPNRRITITRDAVLTANTFYATVREVTTGTTFTSNFIELRDFLDPIQFIETGTATIDTGSAAELTIVPYQNGALMDQVNPNMGNAVPNTNPVQYNTTYTFEINQLSDPEDTGGTLRPFNNLAIGTRFPDNANGRDYGPGRATAFCAHDRTINGARIIIQDDEVGPFGIFLDYTVNFNMVS